MNQNLCGPVQICCLLQRYDRLFCQRSVMYWCKNFRLQSCHKHNAHQRIAGHRESKSWSGLGLTDIAGVAIVAVRVVPPPAKDPQHLRAVFVRVGVVRFVDVPVGVGRCAGVADVTDPMPRRRRRRTVDASPTTHQTDPEVAVTRVCVFDTVPVSFFI